MGSHDVSCHPTQVNTPRFNPSQQAVIDLLTVEGWKLELTYVVGCIPKRFTVTRESGIQVVTGAGAD